MELVVRVITNPLLPRPGPLVLEHSANIYLLFTTWGKVCQIFVHSTWRIFEKTTFNHRYSGAESRDISCTFIANPSLARSGPLVLEHSANIYLLFTTLGKVCQIFEHSTWCIFEKVTFNHRYSREDSLVFNDFCYYESIASTAGPVRSGTFCEYLFVI